MATLKFASPPEPVQLDLRCALSTAAIDNFVAETGEAPAELVTLEVQLSKLPSDQRRRAAAIRGAVHSLYIDISESPFTDEMAMSELYPVLDAPTDDPAVVIAAWETFLEAREKSAAEQSKVKARAQEVEKEKRAALQLEMALWIPKHGSERLITSFERKYKVTSSYVRERAALEFPGFAADIANKAGWQERANPSEKALAAETRALEALEKIGNPPYTVRIVWLTHDTAGNELGAKGSLLGAKREAIVVSGYLGFYDLIGEPDEKVS